MPQQEVVRDLVLLVHSSLEPLEEGSPARGRRVVDAALPSVRAAFDAPADQAFGVHPLQQRVEDAVVDALLPRERRRQRTLELVAMHRLVDEESQYRLLHIYGYLDSRYLKSR